MLKKIVVPVLLAVSLTSLNCYAADDSDSVLKSEKEDVKKGAKKESSSVQKFAENIENLRTYQADFEQRVQNENGKEIDFSSGRFSIQRPNHFRWEVKLNFEQLIVADGDHVFTYDPELEQVTVQNQSKLLADSPLLLMTSDAEALAEAFNITTVDLADKPDSELFQLTPKKEGNIFDSVHILFEKNKIAELLMADTLGQKTSVKFSNIQVNQKLDSAQFSFVIPEGVDVIDSREVPLENGSE
ncbi:outer membrane lipoprotein chaperone LolA [Aliikangiella coralliicola]|uniref:Outer-membrane lipoprotein carrier protein n=1 Tax=Aliikangiella coralliicola TaxID=2592383 RepID=A0A545UAK7_9GAMM|nr:outer membrane lipoprotein chaperone LolA [Aliikangiella coralliicola]TQV86505.1 outer membrane lipoprotein chaperone LolA [Aliikangiella coralliicola]